MNEFLDKLEQLIEQSKEMVSKYEKSVVIQNEAVSIVERFIYSNIISNFERNLTEENIKEFDLSKSDLKKIKKEFKDIFDRCNQTIRTGSNKGAVNSEFYQAFRNKLKIVDRNCYKLLSELEGVIDVSSCKKTVDNLKRDIAKIGKTKGNFDDWYCTLVLEAIISAGKEIPDSKKISKMINNIMSKTLPKSAEVLLNTLKIKSSKMLKERRNYQDGFEKRLMRRWEKPVDLLEMFYVIALESGEEFNKKHREEAAINQDFLFDALTRIHARSCQIFFEIMTLLKNGLADGAFTRWRSLHELAVISLFLIKHGKSVAERYLTHAIIENYKEAVEYRKHCKILGYKPLTRDQFLKLKKAKDAVCAKYGKDFYRDYGWVSSNILKDSNFKEIEESIKMDIWRPFYKMACINVHAGSKSLKFRLGLIQDNSLQEVLLAGPSNYGLADPGQNAAISLHQITTGLLTTKPTMERLITIYAMQNLVREIGKAFCDVQFQIEKEEKIKKAIKEKKTS
jgi:hypothetical protein